MHNLDVRSLVDAFGGRQVLINRVRKDTGVELSIKQVSKWVERNSIPGDHLVTLQMVGEKQTPPVLWRDFISKS